MRILFLHHSFPPSKEDGSGRAYDFAKQLVDDGHHVDIVAGQYSYLTGESVVSKRGWVVVDDHPAGFTVYRAWAARGYHGSYARRILGFVTYMLSSFWAAMRAPRPDLLVAASPPITVAMIGGLVARLRGIPFVFEIRDLWSQVAAELGIIKSRTLMAIVRAWERSLLRQARAVIVNSPGFLPHLERDGVPREKIHLVPNGVDTELFAPTPDRDALRKRLDLEGFFVVAYAGSLGYANDVATVLDAAEHLADLPDVRILLVGDGNRRRQAEATALERGLTNVIFTGAVPKQRVPQYLNAADVCFCTLLDTPLFRTVYPNKVFDAMACARPVVLLVDGVIRTCVEDADAGIFVKPGNAAGFADAVRLLRANPAACEAMGSRGRAAVLADFDRWSCARLMSETLVQVNGGGSPVEDHAYRNAAAVSST
jgi:glycosyltransferase involved in cell wall biosynthesis